MCAGLKRTRVDERRPTNFLTSNEKRSTKANLNQVEVFIRELRRPACDAVMSQSRNSSREF